MREASNVDASRAFLAKFFKAVVREQSAPKGIPFGRPWEEL